MGARIRFFDSVPIGRLLARLSQDSHMVYLLSNRVYIIRPFDRFVITCLIDLLLCRQTSGPLHWCVYTYCSTSSLTPVTLSACRCSIHHRAWLLGIGWADSCGHDCLHLGIYKSSSGNATSIFGSEESLSQSNTFHSCRSSLNRTCSPLQPSNFLPALQLCELLVYSTK